MISDVLNLGAAEGVLSYDPAVIQITQVAPGGFPHSTGRTVISMNPIISPTAGAVTFGYYSLGATPPGPDGSGELFVVTYHTLADGDSHLTLSTVQVANISGSALTPLTLQSGSVRVQPVQRVFLPLIIR